VTSASARVKGSHGAPGFGKPPGNPDFEPRDLMRYRRYLGERVARQQSHSETVRVLQNDRVIGRQAK
jgi:hypothetical protein